MEYRISIQKINPPQENEERDMRLSRSYYRGEENVFEAFVNAEEVIELMKVGYYLKEKAEKLATKKSSN